MWRKLVLLPLLAIPIAIGAFLLQQKIVHIAWLDEPEILLKPPLTESFRIDSAQTGKAYDIYIQLPPEYRQNATPYPVIYTIDTRRDFIDYQAVIEPLLRQSKIPEVILVSVSPARAAGRSRNAAGPAGIGGLVGWAGKSKELDLWLEDMTRTARQYPRRKPSGGKAEAFVGFFEKELFPKIEREYRTVSGDRCLVGYDVGAVFVVETALTHPELFRRYLALAPLAGFADSAPIKLAQERIRSTYDPKVRMYFSMGANDDPPSLDSFQRLADVMKSGRFKNLQFRSEILPKPDHTGIVVPGAQAGLTFLYEKQ